MRVDILGQVLADAIRDAKSDPNRWTSVLVHGDPSIAPRINVEPTSSAVWVHLDSGPLSVLITIPVREPAGDGGELNALGRSSPGSPSPR